MRRGDCARLATLLLGGALASLAILAAPAIREVIEPATGARAQGAAADDCNRNAIQRRNP